MQCDDEAMTLIKFAKTFLLSSSFLTLFRMLCAFTDAALSCSLIQKSIERFLCFLSGKKLGYTFDYKNFHNVSLGQGQEVIAEQALDLAAKNGHWVILQVQYTRAHTTAVSLQHKIRATILTTTPYLF